MRGLDYLGDALPPPARADDSALERRVIQKRLNRVLAFTGLTIDDVVNSPIARNQVIGYWKLSKLIDRRGEVLDLERQWNPNARRG